MYTRLISANNVQVGIHFVTRGGCATFLNGSDDVEFVLCQDCMVERRPAPRRGFRGGCCQPTALHRLCRQPKTRRVVVDAAHPSSTSFDATDLKLI